jgi:hypothetical protein
VSDGKVIALLPRRGSKSPEPPTLGALASFPGHVGCNTPVMIRKLAGGKYRLYSRKKDPKTGKRRNLGTFATRAAAQAHERAVQFFKRR